MGKFLDDFGEEEKFERGQKSRGKNPGAPPHLDDFTGGHMANKCRCGLSIAGVAGKTDDYCASCKRNDAVFREAGVHDMFPDRSWITTPYIDIELYCFKNGIAKETLKDWSKWNLLPGRRFDKLWAARRDDLADFLRAIPLKKGRKLKLIQMSRNWLYGMG